MNVRDMTDEALHTELTRLRDLERANNKRTKAGRANSEDLMKQITPLALEEGRRWRISMGIRLERDL